MKIALLLPALALCAAGFAERPDPWITGKVQSALVFHKTVNGLQIQVETAAGVVTLRGEADSAAQKDLAAEYAAEVEGVKKVVNLVTVKGERAPGARGIDAAITAQVRSALLARPATRALKISAATNDAVVTLRGAVKSAAEQELAEKIARSVPGVRGVANRLTVDRAASGGAARRDEGSGE